LALVSLCGAAIQIEMSKIALDHIKETAFRTNWVACITSRNEHPQSKNAVGFMRLVCARRDDFPEVVAERFYCM